MGHDKLRKFAENETFACLLQPDAASVLDKSADPSRGLVLRKATFGSRSSVAVLAPFHRRAPLMSTPM